MAKAPRSPMDDLVLELTAGGGRSALPECCFRCSPVSVP